MGIGYYFMRKQERAKWILITLKKAYPDAHCALNYANPFQLLVATILSAQCTDKRVNEVTATLFKKYPDPKAFASSDLSELQNDVRPTGFFRNKASAIQESSLQILSEHGGQVPNDMLALTKLKGVGRKTASVVMGNAFDNAQGVVVDTHIGRLSRRLGLSKHQSPEKVEQDLMKLIPREDWVLFPHLMIFHGRAVCTARKTLCADCVLQENCPSAQ